MNRLKTLSYQTKQMLTKFPLEAQFSVKKGNTLQYNLLQYSAYCSMFKNCYNTVLCLSIVIVLYHGYSSDSYP